MQNDDRVFPAPIADEYGITVRDLAAIVVGAAIAAQYSSPRAHADDIANAAFAVVDALIARS